jgi:hypothetical protein
LVCSSPRRKSAARLQASSSACRITAAAAATWRASDHPPGHISPSCAARAANGTAGGYRARHTGSSPRSLKNLARRSSQSASGAAVRAARHERRRAADEAGADAVKRPRRRGRQRSASHRSRPASQRRRLAWPRASAPGSGESARQRAGAASPRQHQQELACDARVLHRARRPVATA